MSNSKIHMEVPYFQTPNAIYDVEDIDIYQQAVYIYLCRCGNCGAKAFPSYATIAEKTHMSKRKAMECVDDLISRGFIKKKPRTKAGKSLTNVYYVNTMVHSMHRGSAQDAPYKEPVINKPRKYTKKQLEAAAGLAQIEIYNKRLAK